MAKFKDLETKNILVTDNNLVAEQYRKYPARYAEIVSNDAETDTEPKRPGRPRKTE